MRNNKRQTSLNSCNKAKRGSCKGVFGLVAKSCQREIIYCIKIRVKKTDRIKTVANNEQLCGTIKSTGYLKMVIGERRERGKKQADEANGETASARPIKTYTAG